MIAVRAAVGHPVLVSTSRHVSQGIVDVNGEKWSAATTTLSGTSQVIGNDPYELRIAGLQDAGRNWTLVWAKVSSVANNAGITVQPKPLGAGEEGWLRVVINSKESCPVKWLLKFAMHEHAGRSPSHSGL